jgi:iron(III) transport system substrate-binding protein
MRRSLAALASLLVFALVAGACGSGDADTLTVYSGRSEELIGPLLESFTDETGIDVDVRYDSSANLALLIDEEGDRTPADVFISQSPGAVGFLAERDLLQPLAEQALDEVDARFRNADGLWVGLSGRARVLVYNTEMVSADELPASIFDLTDEAYAGRVALAPANGSFQDFVTAMRDIHGDDVTADWLGAMASNDSPTYASNSAIVEAVGRGEVPMGLVNHYYNFRALAENPSLDSQNHFFAEGDVGSIIIVTATGVTSASGNEDAANRFIEFMLSESAQSFYSEETFEYPLASGAEPPEGLPPLDSIGGATYDFDDLGGGLERTKELIDESGFESS